MMPEPTAASGGNGRPGTTTFDRIMIAIVAVSLASVCLLISATHGSKTGYQEWAPGSVLRNIVDLLNFNYAFPTSSGSEVKWLAHGLGVAAAVLAVTLMWFTRSDVTRPITVEEPTPAPAGRRCCSTVALAQIALVLLTLWMVISSQWSPWPEASLGEGSRQAIWTIWALILGRTLTRAGARGVAVAMTAILTATAALGIWYRHERSPFMRLEFPIGNPLFMAACLIVGLCLAGAIVFGVLAETMDRSRERKTAPARMFAEVIRDMGGWWVAIGAVVGVAVMMWALRLTESRTAQWALVAGAAVAVWLGLGRLGRWLLPVGAVGAAALFFALNWSAVTSGTTGRDATIRFRLYAGKYAIQLFSTAPIVGHGQGSYMLLAQAMQAPDMEKDSAAFMAPVIENAHNEYLQIAAETGLVGSVLCAAFLVLTMWGAIRAWSRVKTPLDQWLLAGALAAFTAVVIEELGDVALRKPGLPAVFYTTAGLTWALSLRLPAAREPIISSQPTPLRVAGLIAGIAASLGIAWTVWRNWEGALAAYQILTRAEEQEWDASMNAARIASSGRLAVEDYVEAYDGTTHVSLIAAAGSVDRCMRGAARLPQDAEPPAGLVDMIREDVEAFNRFASICEATGNTLLVVIPGYPRIAWILAHLQVYRQQVEMIERQAGLRADVRDYTAAVRTLLSVELSRDPQDMAVAMRLFELCGDESVAYRLNLLRRPLRRGPVPVRQTDRFGIDWLADMEPLIGAMINEKGFSEAMEKMLADARQAMAANSADDWPDPYAPESLRLSARVSKLSGRFLEAAELSGQAAELSRQLGGRFPGAVSNARLDQSRYLMLAQRPAEAVAACDQAIKEWPIVRERELQLRPVMQTRAMYMLAADSEKEARELLGKLYPEAASDEIDQRLSDGYVDLCQSFASFPIEARAASYDKWLQRALALDPGNRTTHDLAARRAAERQDDVAVVEHVKAVIRLSFEQKDDSSGLQYLRLLAGVTRDENLVMALVEELSKSHPGNAMLQRLLASGPTAIFPPTTATAPTDTSSAPASRPTTMTEPGT
ncbi:MAG TPA: O-antigen ligase family protein [Phycisphaerae bacterium]|nr:O-antigen ligase family protein [Phycisphaerae bacterium]HRR84209.1 O-antigen ligase family protein [Phycisphaerae bacterium]